MEAGITVEYAKEQLEIWLKANAVIATGQSYKIGTRWLTRVDSSSILEQIKFWQNQVNQLSRRGRNRIWSIVPRDN